MVPAAVSLALGWGYFAAWSVSFYPQLILNWRLGHVVGLSPDFTWLNVLGFTCYSIFTVGTLLADTGADDSGVVRVNDAVFAVHALVASAATAAQLVMLSPRAAPPKLSPAPRAAITFAVALLALAFLALPLRAAFQVAAAIKVAVSASKYIPQLLLNAARKSTTGWAIENILLDAIGGFLSFAQLFVDASNAGTIWLVFDNPAKLLLGLLAMGFDILFILQHYVWYKDSYAVLEDDAHAES